MRNSNGYGSVVKLLGKRRKPFAVRKTIGWNSKAHPVYEIIGYCETREEGMLLLAEYNKNPWDVNKSKITLQELYDLWQEKKAVKLGSSNKSALKSAYNHISKMSNTEYKEIKAYHMQDCIDTCGKGYSTQSAIKNLWTHLDKFALELDISEKGYSNLLTTTPVPPTSRDRFTDEEIKKVWDLYNNRAEVKDLPVEWIDTVLIFLYTGFRISELLLLKTEDVNLTDMTFKGGVKTNAGKNRIVPIHSAIRPIVENRLNTSFEYFISVNGERVPGTSYRPKWAAIMAYLNIDKTPHECRHTFESVLDSNGANRKCIDLMMGHTSKDVGNRVYNHKTIEELREAIELFKMN